MEHYGPEDIEQLLTEKAFAELYPEEREYVLRHVADEAEYETMRNLLLSFTDEAMPMPPLEMREGLIDKHREHHKAPRFKVWLNGLLAYLIPEQKPSFALQLAGIAAVIALGVWLFQDLRTDLSETQTAQEIDRIRDDHEASPAPTLRDLESTDTLVRKKEEPLVENGRPESLEETTEIYLDEESVSSTEETSNGASSADVLITDQADLVLEIEEEPHMMTADEANLDVAFDESALAEDAPQASTTNRNQSPKVLDTIESLDSDDMEYASAAKRETSRSDFSAFEEKEGGQSEGLLDKDSQDLAQGNQLKVASYLIETLYTAW